MRCAWDAYINLLPHWMRETVDKQGRDNLQELRLRIDIPPEMITANGSIWLSREVRSDDIQFCINSASRYSPWTTATSAQGYITAEGGHRIGVCGDAVVSDGVMSGIRTPLMLCLRVARDYPGIAGNLAQTKRSVLIIGRPGSGKTTLLRDLIRSYSNSGTCVAVVDERGELFPIVRGTSCFPRGNRTDVLTGCSKNQGIDAVLRCMNPGIIAVDEITAEKDCCSLIHAGWCGVQLLATAHAGSIEELYTRPVYKSIINSKLFDTLLVLQADKSWTMERMRK